MSSRNVAEVARSSGQINSYTNLLTIEETGPLVITRGDALTICLPLIINENEIDQLFDTLWQSLDEVEI